MQTARECVISIHECAAHSISSHNRVCTCRAVGCAPSFRPIRRPCLSSCCCSSSRLCRGQFQPSVPPDVDVIPPVCTNQCAFFPLQIAAYSQSEGPSTALPLSPPSFESGVSIYSADFYAYDSRSSDPRSPEVYLAVWLPASPFTHNDRPLLESYVLYPWAASWLSALPQGDSFSLCDPWASDGEPGPIPDADAVGNSTCLQISSWFGFDSVSGGGTILSLHARLLCRFDHGMTPHKHARLSSS